ncbi:recombinase [Streptococcus suis]|nr:recombinase [Streptococcus suis]MBY5021232.1 recombinase [Streptococcus suis]HEL1639863.1 recombinase [Streptococcus suis]HEL9645503.1 recombinase [Streptococcus suis]
MTENILQVVERFLTYSEIKLEELAEKNQSLKLDDDIEE